MIFVVRFVRLLKLCREARRHVDECLAARAESGFKGKVQWGVGDLTETATLAAARHPVETAAVIDVPVVGDGFRSRWPECPLRWRHLRQ